MKTNIYSKLLGYLAYSLLFTPSLANATGECSALANAQDGFGNLVFSSVEDQGIINGKRECIVTRKVSEEGSTYKSGVATQAGFAAARNASLGSFYNHPSVQWNVVNAENCHCYGTDLAKINRALYKWKASQALNNVNVLSASLRLYVSVSGKQDDPNFKLVATKAYGGASSFPIPPASNGNLGYHQMHLTPNVETEQLGLDFSSTGTLGFHDMRRFAQRFGQGGQSQWIEFNLDSLSHVTTNGDFTIGITSSFDRNNVMPTGLNQLGDDPNVSPPIHNLSGIKINITASESADGNSARIKYRVREN